MNQKLRLFPRPVKLSRVARADGDDLADMIGTIETAIRLMSRRGKENLVRTEKEGFVLVDRPALEANAVA